MMRAKDRAISCQREIKAPIRPALERGPREVANGARHDNRSITAQTTRPAQRNGATR